MSSNLAAAAADFEHVDGDIDFDALIAEAATPDPMIARDALIRLAKAEAEIAEVSAVKAQIVDRYDDRLGKLAARVARERQTVQAYVTRFGNVKFPDVGGAHLTTKAKGGRIVVDDLVALEAWLEANEIEPPRKPAAIDVPATVDVVAKTMKVHATPAGLLVNYETGETVEIPGLTVEAETKTLAVKKG